MKNSVALLCFAFGLLPVVTPAFAASPAYCALYAREYAAARIGGASGDQAASALQRVSDQAYYRCLNMDEEPELPTTSAYFGTEDTDSAIGGPFDVIEQGDASAGDETPADVPDGTDKATATASIATVPDATPLPDVTTENQPAAKPKPKPIRLASSAGSGRGPKSSGLTQWSDEWVSWCKSHYRSFNSTTGMVLTGSGQRRMCP